MAALDDIAQERQRLVERLGRVDGERAQLMEQLAELEAAERVLSRLAQESSRTGRRAAAPQAAATAAPRRGRGERRPAAAKTAALSLGDASLRAVAAHGHGISAAEIRGYLAREFGMQVRANHLGMALQRHRRAGRLDQRDQLWYPRQSADGETAPS